MSKVDDAMATFDRNIEAATGRTMVDWSVLINATGLAKHGAIMSLLKEQHKVSHAHANRIAKYCLDLATPRSSDDPVAHLFTGEKALLRPIYDRLASFIMTLGDDVELAPKKANVSVRRRKQFALIQPSTKTRVDLGLILPNHPPEARLELSGSFNAMFSHRVQLAHLSEIDAEVEVWLKQAYTLA